MQRRPTSSSAHRLVPSSRAPSRPATTTTTTTRGIIHPRQQHHAGHDKDHHHQASGGKLSSTTSSGVLVSASNSVGARQILSRATIIGGDVHRYYDVGKSDPDVLRQGLQTTLGKAQRISIQKQIRDTVLALEGVEVVEEDATELVGGPGGGVGGTGTSTPLSASGRLPSPSPPGNGGVGSRSRGVRTADMSARPSVQEETSRHWTGEGRSSGVLGGRPPLRPTLSTTMGVLGWRRMNHHSSSASSGGAGAGAGAGSAAAAYGRGGRSVRASSRGGEDHQGGRRRTIGPGLDVTEAGTRWGVQYNFFQAHMTRLMDEFGKTAKEKLRMLLRGYLSRKRAEKVSFFICLYFWGRGGVNAQEINR